MDYRAALKSLKQIHASPRREGLAVRVGFKAVDKHDDRTIAMDFGAPPSSRGLHQEKRTDRTGRTQTRWVKGQEQQKITADRAPDPVGVHQDARGPTGDAVDAGDAPKEALETIAEAMVLPHGKLGLMGIPKGVARDLERRGLVRDTGDGLTITPWGEAELYGIEPPPGQNPHAKPGATEPEPQGESSAWGKYWRSAISGPPAPARAVPPAPSQRDWSRLSQDGGFLDEQDHAKAWAWLRANPHTSRAIGADFWGPRASEHGTSANPNDVALLAASLDPKVMKVVDYLRENAGGFTPRDHEIEAGTGMTQRQVKGALKRLDKLGVLDKNREPMRPSGRSWGRLLFARVADSGRAEASDASIAKTPLGRLMGLSPDHVDMVQRDAEASGGKRGYLAGIGRFTFHAEGGKAAGALPDGTPILEWPGNNAKNSEGYPIVARIRFQGLPPIEVEQRKGDVRRGDGWARVQPYHYGGFIGTEGRDGDPVDVCVGPDAYAPFAYIVHQKAPGQSEDDSYDEDKCLVGFRTQAEAVEAYRQAYDRPGFLGSVTKMSIGELQAWLGRAKNRGQRISLRRLERPEAGKAIDTRLLELDAIESQPKECEGCESDPCLCEHGEEGAKAADGAYRIPEHLRWVSSL